MRNSRQLGLISAWIGVGVAITLVVNHQRSKPGFSPESGQLEQVRSSSQNPKLLTNPVLSRDLDSATLARLNDLEALARKDPASSLDRLPFFRDHDLLPNALAAIARGWSLNDAPAAAGWVAGIESQDDQVSAVLGLVPNWMAQDPEACLDWVQSRPIGNLREVALVEIADSWVSRQPREALERFRAMQEEPGVERGIFTIATQWALDDPAAAVEHISSMPASKQREDCLESALVSLTHLDPALTWKEATRMATPEKTEHVRAMAVEAIAETNPQEAIRLANSAGNPTPLLRGIARGWDTLDSLAADEWIHSQQDPVLVEILKREIAR